MLQAMSSSRSIAAGLALSALLLGCRSSAGASAPRGAWVVGYVRSGTPAWEPRAPVPFERLSEESWRPLRDGDVVYLRGVVEGKGEGVLVVSDELTGGTTVDWRGRTVLVVGQSKQRYLCTGSDFDRIIPSRPLDPHDYVCCDLLGSDDVRRVVIRRVRRRGDEQRRYYR